MIVKLQNLYRLEQYYIYKTELLVFFYVHTVHIEK